MKLFQVSTKKYKDYYVMANDYNEAVGKAKAFRETEITSVVDNDGSLVVGSEEDYINTVRLLTENIIK